MNPTEEVFSNKLSFPIFSIQMLIAIQIKNLAYRCTTLLSFLSDLLTEERDKTMR
jgi:hypothetical protein